MLGAMMWGMSMSGQPGWYPVLRWWDGFEWTEQQPLPPPQQQPQPVQEHPKVAITRPTFWSGGVKGMMFDRKKTTYR